MIVSNQTENEKTQKSGLFCITIGFKLKDTVAYALSISDTSRCAQISQDHNPGRGLSWTELATGMINPLCVGADVAKSIESSARECVEKIKSNAGKEWSKAEQEKSQSAISGLGAGLAECWMEVFDEEDSVSIFSLSGNLPGIHVAFGGWEANSDILPEIQMNDGLLRSSMVDAMTEGARRALEAKMIETFGAEAFLFSRVQSTETLGEAGAIFAKIEHIEITREASLMTQGGKKKKPRTL